MYELIVKNPFDGYKKGDIITDQQKISEILSGPKSANVLKKAAASPNGESK